MVYHHVGIHHISPSQKMKLKKGMGVRMHLGSHHKMPPRADQIKKLESAHRKGAASTVSLDPYQIDMLHGTGFFDTLKSVVSHPVTKAISRAVRPMAVNALKGVASSALGPMGSQVAHSLIDVADSQAAAHGYGVKRKPGRPRKHYVHHDKRIVNGMIVEPVERGRKLKSVKGKGWGMDLLKAGSKALRPIATDYLHKKLAATNNPLAQQVGTFALNLANQEAEKRGFGVHKKKRGRPRKGGALIAAGY